MHGIEFQKHGGVLGWQIYAPPVRAVELSIRFAVGKQDAAFMLPPQLEAVEFQLSSRWSDDEIVTSIIPEQSRQAPAS